MSSLKKESIYFALSVFCALGAIISSMIAPNKLFGAAIGFAILCSIMIGIMFYLLNKRHIDEKHDAATAIGLSYERIETKLDSLLDSINNEYAISGELYRNFITKIAETTVSVAQHVSSVEDTICNLKDQQEKYHYKLLGTICSRSHDSLPGTENIVLYSLSGTVLHKRNVLVSCCMINNIRLILLKDFVYP